MRPIITDNDVDEITATYNDKPIRQWSYRHSGEHRQKMREAREFVEGWVQALRLEAKPC